MARELKANDKLVKEDEEEKEDHGLLLADGVRVRECSLSIGAEV